MAGPNETEKDTHRIDVGACPECGAFMDGHAHVGEKDATPAGGDVTVCVYCTSPLVYTKRGDRLVLVACLLDLLEEELRLKLLRMIGGIRRFKEQNPDAFQEGKP